MTTTGKPLRARYKCALLRNRSQNLRGPLSVARVFILSMHHGRAQEAAANRHALMCLAARAFEEHMRPLFVRSIYLARDTLVRSRCRPTYSRTNMQPTRVCVA